MNALLLGLVIFLGAHSVSIINDPWRNRLAARMGEWPWKGLYALVSIAGFVLIVWGYGLARQDPVVLYTPPAWLHGPGLADLLRQRDLDLTEGFWTIANLVSGRRVFAPALSWSTARPWRWHLTAGIARARGLVEAPRGLVRVAIHPPDVEMPVVTRSLTQALTHLTGTRATITYRQVVGTE